MLVYLVRGVCHFNWIGFPSSESRTLEEAFAGFEPAEGDQIISFDNSAIYEEGEWDGLLTSLYPGKGYIYISHASGDKTLIFGTGNNKCIPGNLLFINSKE